MQSKFGALHIIITVQKISAYLVLIVTVLGFIFAISQGLFLESLGGLFSGVVLFISQLAIAQVLELFVQIEANTRRSATIQRKTAVMLQRMMNSR